MRPIRLKLKNFRIFRGEHEVDFSCLNFFVIQGRTGSGKSSIVDAICYALYGRVPREGSKPAHRNVISRGESRMRVFLEFSVKGKRYAVERVYSQDKSDVRFYEGSRPLPLKAKDVESYVENLLGLSYDVFTKVLVLPQGQFDRFLKPSKPVERREILHKLIGIEETIEGLTRLIKDEKDKRKKATEDLKVYIENCRKELGSLPDLEQRERELKKEIEELKTRKELLESELRQAEERESLQKDLLDVEEQLTSLIEKEEEIRSLEEKLKRAEDLREYKGYLEHYDRIEEDIKNKKRESNKKQNELEKYKHEYDITLQLYQEAKRKYEQLPDIEREIEDLVVKIQKAEQMDKLKEDMIRTNKELLEREKEKEEKLRRKSELEERLEKGKRLLKEWEEELRSLEGTEGEYKRLETLQQDVKEYEKKERELSQIDEVLRSLEEEKKNLEGELSSLRRKEEEYLVHKIRSNLKKGDICPVCGHVVEEVHADQIDTDYRELREKIEHIADKISKLTEQIASLKQKKEEYKGRLQTIKEKIGTTTEGFWELWSKVQENYKKLQELREKYIKGQTRYEELRKEYETLTQEMARLDERVNHLKTRKAELEKELSELSEFVGDVPSTTYLRNQKEELEMKKKKVIDRYEKLREELQGKENLLQMTKVELDTLRKRLEELEREKLDVVGKLKPVLEKYYHLDEVKKFIMSEEEMKEVREKIEEYRNRRSLLEKRKEELYEKLSSLPQVRSSVEIIKEKDEVEKDLEEKQRELGALEERINRVKSFSVELRRKEEELRCLIEELAIYEKLAEDFRSDRFPDFIGTYVMEIVVNRANEYLERFSGGSYYFVLEGGDLMVRDMSSGHTRPVETLSGGETFLASLALAFGVSDIISQKAPLESLFIDEGFGSLDRETRETLEGPFENIKSNSGRLVGIITHLEDMAEKFDQRIEVIRRGDRSEVRIIC
ncbi:SMC domain protein [Thermocrinis albus DSM 14484]|uniref:SMC domain protein n=1 Tax=Thermocrinis albus (strain DSM 14484 / JCM 11386 / HI 11/12) TaxID=638303 RepID=D3SPU8_THEAH|nr:AAA family ATPase [Thermocrinis albus]ADC89185.1 SMC domain protein [Thermocrinis albus DSM 14484]